MPTAIHRFVESARRGENPRVIARLRSGWLVMGEVQITRGYCLLLPDPVAAHLNDLPRERRSVFLEDMADAGDVILRLTGAARINYEMLGNLEPALHAHIIPRYADEPEAVRTKPVWLHDWSGAPKFDATRDGGFMRAVTNELKSRMH